MQGTTATQRPTFEVCQIKCGVATENLLYFDQMNIIDTYGNYCFGWVCKFKYEWIHINFCLDWPWNKCKPNECLCRLWKFIGGIMVELFMKQNCPRGMSRNRIKELINSNSSYQLMGTTCSKELVCLLASTTFRIQWPFGMNSSSSLSSGPWLWTVQSRARNSWGEGVNDCTSVLLIDCVLITVESPPTMQSLPLLRST